MQGPSLPRTGEKRENLGKGGEKGGVIEEGIFIGGDRGENRGRIKNRILNEQISCPVAGRAGVLGIKGKAVRETRIRRINV